MTPCLSPRINQETQIQLFSLSAEPFSAKSRLTPAPIQYSSIHDNTFIGILTTDHPNQTQYTPYPPMGGQDVVRRHYTPLRALALLTFTLYLIYLDRGIIAGSVCAVSSIPSTPSNTNLLYRQPVSKAAWTASISAHQSMPLELAATTATHTPTSRADAPRTAASAGQFARAIRYSSRALASTTSSSPRRRPASWRATSSAAWRRRTSRSTCFRSGWLGSACPSGARAWWFPPWRVGCSEECVRTE